MSTAAPIPVLPIQDKPSRNLVRRVYYFFRRLALNLFCFPEFRKYIIISRCLRKNIYVPGQLLGWHFPVGNPLFTSLCTVFGWYLFPITCESFLSEVCRVWVTGRRCYVVRTQGSKCCFFFQAWCLLWVLLDAPPVLYDSLLLAL